MKTYPLVLNNGHLFVSTPDGSFLLDTGAPTSFGAVTFDVKLEMADVLRH